MCVSGGGVLNLLTLVGPSVPSPKFYSRAACKLILVPLAISLANCLLHTDDLAIDVRVCRHALPTSDSKTRDNATTRSTEAREADIAGLHDSMFG